MQCTFYGFLALDILTLVVAVFKICSAASDKKKGEELASQNQQDQNNQRGYDPLLYSTNPKDKKKQQ